MIQTSIISVDIKTPGASDYLPTMSCYLPNDGKKDRPAALIFSGGAYKVVSQYEAGPTARKLAEHGFASFTVQYSCLPARFPQSLCEGLWCIRYLRRHAEELGIDPGNITAMGFSAGGHLVAAMGTLWQNELLTPYLGRDRADCRPDKLVLCYPVISNEGRFHRDSFYNLVGAEGLQDAELMKLNCLEHQVTPNTPPTFMWHGAADRDVPAEGSVRFLSALLANGVPAEFHLYPFATHGGGLNRNAYHGDWSDKAEIFMRDDRLRGGRA